MKSFKDKTVLIAGASSGMGRLLALKLAGAGARLAVTARRQEKLESLNAEIIANGGQCLAIAADAQNDEAAAAVVAATIAHFGRIDLAVLNAGGAPALDMRIMSVREVNAYMRSNYDVTVNYLFPVLHHMRQNRAGVIAHTNSLAGFLGLPLQGPYSAAKGATRLLMDTCRIEFARYGIKFITIYPGFVANERTANDGMPKSQEISEERAVDYILHALRTEPTDYAFPPNMRRLIRLAHFLPKPLLSWILKKQMPFLPEL